ncbi:peptidase MA family metallohydrolase [Candidatus Latescibacterota bacterium]
MDRYGLWIAVIFLSMGGTVGAGTLEGDHIRVTAEGFTPAYTEDALKSAEQGIEVISAVLGYVPRAPVDIILTASDREFFELTEGAVPEWSAAVAVQGGRVIVTPLEGWKSGLSQILTHELVHVFIEDAAGGRFVPRWFHEGCAQFLAGEWGIRDQVVLVWYTLRGDLLTFEQIQDIFSSGRVEATLAYDQSLLAVRRLRAVHGDGILADIVRGLGAGDSFAEAFRGATGIWPSEFEGYYLAYIREVYGWRSLYLLLPSIWTVILILAVVVYIIKRQRNRRLLRQWEVIEAAEKIVNIEDFTRNS